MLQPSPLPREPKAAVREGAPVPFSQPPERVVVVHAVPPQWEAPDYDAQPWEDRGEDCVKFYETPTYVYAVRVPEMSFVTIEGVSYQWNTDRSVGDVFVVEILRNHDTLATWEDRVVTNSGVPGSPADLGNRFAISAHHRPVPCFASFDRNDIIGCRVTFRGPHPFGVPNNTPIPGLPRFRVLFNGWRSTITNNADGQVKNRRFSNADLIGWADNAMRLVRCRGGRF